MSARTWPSVVAAAVLVGAVVGLGIANPVPDARISTDRLGPDAGEQVTEYLDRARGTLADDPAAGADTRHWALVSLAAPAAPQHLLDVTADLRVAQVLLRVPLDRVQTPMVAIPVAANPTAVLRASGVAAARLHTSIVGHDRQSLVAAYSAAQLSDGCACVVGATVRGTLDQLRLLADTPGVRVVEALPPDAVAGSFAVSPLLPEQVGTVAPGPDDGPVPIAT
ncbi:hypothetical protein [Rhodococcus sp. SGAir0479]|uniref:hypothetical protein n=1 Tax=Rhodococcus sp. SGAir0479 TaxID=2567884 RepID=UPI0010CCD958|nr:hypothetical protein [Rhodococcus sp. SGAir0479]QCQ91480.1 hypothetical protein E7742_09680 [Rhodococcus sp. SGAir0479]